MPVQIPTLGRGIQAPAPVVAPTFPLRVSDSGRFLVTPTNTPWRMQCDATWLATTRASLSQWNSYLTTRKAQGFNCAILMAIVGSDYVGITGQGAEPTNSDGDAPFTVANDFSTPNSAYFSKLQSMVSAAYAAGVAIFLFPTYWGYSGPSANQGWWNAINSNTLTVCQNWGSYLGNLLKSYPNIILGTGGDYTADPVGDASTITKTIGILNGMRGAGGFSAQWLAGNEWNNPDTLAQAQGGFTYGRDPASANQNLGTFYGCGPSGNGQTFTTAASSYSSGTTLPSIIQEACYEDENNLPGISGTRENMRAYHYWAVLGGSTAGQCFGAKYLWWWSNQSSPNNYVDRLTSPASLDISKSFLSLYPTLAWWRHAPAQSRIVSGGGSGSSTVVCSLDSGGLSLMAYRASSGTGTQSYNVDLRGLTGPARGRWFNPTTGTFVDITGGLYTLSNATASQSFTTPGDNGTGTNDWVLVLDV